jgi:flagellar basal body-associated protein FliL
MKSKLYLWILIGVALLLCAALLIIGGNLSKENKSVDNNVAPVIEESIEDIGGNMGGVVEVKKDDLMMPNVDFEEDADDLSDNIADDAMFDESLNVASIENNVY